MNSLRIKKGGYFTGLILAGVLYVCLMLAGCHTHSNHEEKPLKLWKPAGLSLDKNLLAFLTSDPSSGSVWVLGVSNTYLQPAVNLPVSVFYSRDTGHTWSYYNFTGTENYTADLSSLGADSAWIMIGGLGLMRTTNAGQSWDTICTSLKGNFIHPWLHFFNPREAVVRFRYRDEHDGLDSIRIFVTNDGGYNWTEVPHRVKGSEWTMTVGKKLFQVNSASIAFTTEKGNIYLSSDKGRSWKEVFHHSFPDELLCSLAMLSEKRMVVSSLGKVSLTKDPKGFDISHARLFYTEDGGINWKRADSSAASCPFLFAVPHSDSLCIAASQNTLGSFGIFLSSNGGKTFRTIDSTTAIQIMGFSSIYQGYGIMNDPSLQMNQLFQWNPEFLFQKGIQKRSSAH